MPRPRHVLVIGLCVSCAPLAAQTTCHDLAPFVAVVQQTITNLQLPGLTLRLDQHGQNVLLQSYGTHTPATTMPIASASKPLAAAVLLSLADQNLLALDDPVGLYLPEFAVPPYSAITLRMCLSHTSGLPTFDPVTTDPTLTLRQAAARIAQMPLHFAPGTAFDYGNVSIHVAGAVCEVVAGMAWEPLFQQRLAIPLGMTTTTFAPFGPNANPGVADGAWSDVAGYTNFLSMLRQRGAWNGGRVLSEAAVAEMLSDQMGNRPVIWTPHPFGAPCGLGLWLERRDAAGRTTLACAPGAFGFFGWLDAEHDATGVWLATTFYVWTYPYLLQAWRATDVALEPLGVTCLGGVSPACAPAPRFHALAAARDGNPAFGVGVVDAPPSVFGGCSFAIGAPGPAVVWVDLVNRVPSPLALLVMPTDANGAAALPFGLPPGLAGLRFVMQSAFVLPGSCGVSGFVASNALDVTVLP